jgi:hypothetical protein
MRSDCGWHGTLKAANTKPDISQPTRRFPEKNATIRAKKQCCSSNYLDVVRKSRRLLEKITVSIQHSANKPWQQSDPSCGCKDIPLKKVAD